MDWNKETEQKYTVMLHKIPVFHRGITDEIVRQKAPELAKERGANVVEECDVAKSFLTEVPKCFYSMMTRLMEEVGMEYRKYE